MARKPASRKPRDEISWKIVEAQCVQLTDAVKSARIPFLLALLWAFLWSWSLYSFDFGYLVFYRHRLVQSIHYKDAAANSQEIKQFWGDCGRVTAFPFPPDHVHNEDEKKDCVDALQKRDDWAEKAYLESTTISFPGGFAKQGLSDLGIVGQVGLLLILAWAFYSTRRENDAIRAFVDLDDETRRLGYFFPKKFLLVPQDDFFSAERLTYAYHAVAQRFMFILARYNRPLLGATIALASLPSAVAVWGVISDVEGLWYYRLDPSLVVRFGISVVLLIVVVYVTFNTIRYMVETSVILNGWCLASTKVWINQLNEAPDEPACTADIDIERQTAKPVLDD